MTTFKCKKLGSVWVTNVIKNGKLLCRGFGKTQLKSFRVARVRMEKVLIASAIIIVSQPSQVGFASAIYSEPVEITVTEYEAECLGRGWTVDVCEVEANLMIDNYDFITRLAR